MSVLFDILYVFKEKNIKSPGKPRQKEIFKEYIQKYGKKYNFSWFYLTLNPKISYKTMRNIIFFKLLQHFRFPYI